MKTLRKGGIAGLSRGFTLLEISLAVVIGFMMLSLALPSMRGLFAEQRLRDRMQQFEEFVRKAEALARDSRKEVRLVWEKEGVRMVRLDPSAEEMFAQESVPGALLGELFTFSEEEGISLVRVAARDAEPAWEWCFWPAGVREPAEVYYYGPTGRWALRFGPLVPDPQELSVEPF